MPYIVSGDTTLSKVDSDIYKADYGYKYPDGLDLKPGSKLHTKIKDQLMSRARDSRNETSKRFPSWRKIDQVLTTYIPLKDKDIQIKEKDSTKPVSIIFPYTYSMLEALLTYLSLAFFQDPMLQYEGTGPEDVQGAMLMELVIRLHCYKSKVPLAVHTALRDSLSYGIGLSTPAWTVTHGRRPIKSSIITQSDMSQSSEQQIEWIDDVIFEGNRLDSIDPYMWFPDPSVSSDKVQDGEFVGWMVRDNYMNTLSDEQSSPQGMFNTKYLKHVKDRRSTFSVDESDRELKFKKTSPPVVSSLSPVDKLYMYVNLIPKDWELGPGEYPEKWMFCLASDEIILQAQKSNLAHGMYPVSVASPEFDGYSPTPIGRIEILSGLQETLDWLFNCYDKRTEVLTSAGWLYISDAKKLNADVATVDPTTGVMWYEKPKQWFEYDFDGTLKLFESKRYSLAVTENHNMFGKYRRSSEKEFVKAADIHSRSEWDEFKIPTAVYFSGSQPDPIVFDEIKPIRDRGNERRYPKATVYPYYLAGFLGWFLSDGSISQGKSSGTYLASIKQVKERYFSEIDFFTSNLPFHVGKYYNKKQKSYQWSITDKRFFNWLKDNCYYGGTTGEFKEVPEIIRHADRVTLGRFFESFIHGDGHVYKDHENLVKIGVESKQLADDLQEIAIKLGYSCLMTTTVSESGKPFWYLSINKNAPWATIASRNSSDMAYKDKIYCFENSTHLTVVRRDGKVSICGQSHTANVRKAINDMFVVDPYLVNIEDIKDPKPGKLIRLRRPAWGKGVDKVVQQFPVTDITKQNIADSAYITQWMDRISGADQSMSGAQRQGGPERLTKGEFQGTRGSAISRLQRLAMIIGMQYIQDIGTMFAVHTQQFMSQEVYVKAIGRNAESLINTFGQKDRIPVSIYDLAINYDTIVRDGSIPGGNFSDAWLQLFQTIGTSPELNQQFDVTRIFMYIAQQLGAKNVEDFKRNVNRINPTVMPDEQVEREVQAGNMIPTDEAF